MHIVAIAFIIVALVSGFITLILSTLLLCNFFVDVVVYWYLSDSGRATSRGFMKKPPQHPRPDNLPFHYQYRYSAKQADYYRGEGT